MIKNQKGFAHWVLLILVLGAIIAIGLVTLKHQGAKSAAKSGQSTKVASDLPNCNGKAGILQYSPIAINDVDTIVPLGNMAPPGHVIPTVHMYYTYKQQPNSGNFPVKTTIITPANMTVTKISLEDNASSAHPFNSYRVEFAICKQITGYFYHPITLNDKLTAAMKPPYDQTSTSYVGTGYEHNYSKYVNVKLTAGEVFGTGGGAVDLPDGLDFGLQDTRSSGTVANQARWKAADTLNYVCSLDYLPVSISAQLYARIGDFESKLVNPGDPRCGSVYQDVPGTAQGDWFASNLAKDTFWDVNGQLALVHSNFDHKLGIFSMGNDVQKIGLSSNSIISFTPTQTGSVNLDFNLVKPGKIYCYNTKDEGQYNHPAGPSILIQLTGPSSLKIGKTLGATCGSEPWQFTQSLDYVR